MYYVYSGKERTTCEPYTVFRVDTSNYNDAYRMAKTLNMSLEFNPLPGGFSEHEPQCNCVYIDVPLDTVKWPEPKKDPISENIYADTFEYRGFTVTVEPDSTDWYNREYADNLGVMFCNHNRYRLGDEDADDPRTIVNYKPSDFDMECSEDSAEWNEFMGYFDPTEGDRGREWSETIMERELVILPLYLYDHGGITLGTFRQCSWDSSFVGWLYARKGKEGMTDEQIESCMLNELKYYSAYLEGNFYWYKIEDDAGNDIEDGSCGGWVGYDNEGMMESITGTIDYHIIWEANKKFEEELEQARVDTISYSI